MRTSGDPAAAKRAQAILIDARNQKMVAELDRLLRSTTMSQYFVVVGAGHLLGETGLVTGLGQRGYSVQAARSEQGPRGADSAVQGRPMTPRARKSATLSAS